MAGATLRLAVAAASAALLLAATGSSASAGYFVFDKGPDVWLSRDDGSGAGVLITSQSVNEASIGKPAVQPGGDAVAAESFNSDAARVYSWVAGKATLVGRGGVSAQGNLIVGGGSHEPDVTADGRVVFSFTTVARSGECGIFGCASEGQAAGGFRSTALDGSAPADILASCEQAGNPTANPANPAQIAYTGCDTTFESKPFGMNDRTRPARDRRPQPQRNQRR